MEITRFSLLTSLALCCIMLTAGARAQEVVTKPATAADVGSPCSDLGTTVMTGDQTAIFACLKDPATGKTIWKSNTTVIPTCASGKLLASVGAPGAPLQCATLQCRQVAAQPSGGSFWEVAWCAGDEFAMNGGGISINSCGGGEVGFLHTTLPWGVGYGSGWAANGWGGNIAGVDNTGIQVCTTSWATCCKFVPE
jgi:hypothetical protein